MKAIQLLLKAAKQTLYLDSLQVAAVLYLPRQSVPLT